MLELVINGRKAHLGHGLEVQRILPFHRRRMVGPFIFFDHAGPLSVSTDKLGKADIRPHPHIGLSTVSYMFQGAMTHRDNLSDIETILHPGDINWMTAGRGIVHSERFDNPGEAPTNGLELIQTWVALPNGKEEIEPSFNAHPSDTLPAFKEKGVWGRLLVGSAYGLTSPVRSCSPLFYLHIVLKPEAKIALPKEYSERAIYVVKGGVSVGGNDYGPGQMLVFASDKDAVIEAREETLIMMLGGEPVGERFIYWNFVSSSKDRIEQAKADWKEGRFPLPPNDNKEFTPLPEEK